MITVMVSGSEAAVERLNKALEGRGVRVYVNDHRFRGFGGKLRQVRESDLVSIISIKPVGFAGLLWVAVFAFLKLMRKPVVVRWIGTDVLELDRLHGVVYSKLVDNHVAVSPWLVEELAEKRIRARWLSMPSSLMGELEPLPEEFTVLVYLGRDRDRFYGGEILEKLAVALPHVKFMVVGRTPPKLNYANVHYYGFVPPSEMRRIYSQTTVLLRVTEHDGLGLMVLEALSRGRYVIFSQPFPYCLHEEDFAGCLKALSGLVGVTAPNVGGCEYSRRFEQGIWVDKYMRFYMDVLAGRR
jgi:glycosyltransferase involved in cell wall biosynthesis